MDLSKPTRDWLIAVCGFVMSSWQIQTQHVDKSAVPVVWLASWCCTYPPCCTWHCLIVPSSALLYLAVPVPCYSSLLFTALNCLIVPGFTTHLCFTVPHSPDPPSPHFLPTGFCTWIQIMANKTGQLFSHYHWAVIRSLPLGRYSLTTTGQLL